MNATIIITEDGRAQAVEDALRQAGATIAPQAASTDSVRTLTVDWAGSEDELRRVVERAPAASQSEPGGIPSLDQVERQHIKRVLAAANGNKTLAARILGVDRKTLHRKLSQYARSPGEPENGIAVHHG